MNILVFTYDYAEKTLASSFRMRNIVKFYKESNYNIKVLCATHDNQEEAVHISSHSLENRSMFSRIYFRLFYYPDPVAHWVKKVIEFLKMNRSLVEKADQIIVSSPPHSLQLIALWIKNNYPNKIIISDFRDAFVTNHRIKWYTPLHINYAKNMELEIFKKVDCIICNTKTMKQDFIKKYGKYNENIRYIPNGYANSKNIANFREENKKNIIGYFGDSYGGQISKIIYSNLINAPKGNIEFITAGKGDWILSSRFSDKEWKHLGILNQNDLKKYIDYCNILILIMPKGEKNPSPTIPLKAYEYLSSNKTILYFGPKGDCYDLILSQPNTYCFSLESIENLYEIVKEIRISSDVRLEFLKKFNFDVIADKIIKMEDFE